MKVTATVTPKDITDKVSVNNFTVLPGGTGAASVENSQPDLSKGQIVFDVYGTAGTVSTMPNGDVQLEAKDGSTVLGSTMVIVEIPKAIGTPHPTFGPQAVAPAHYVLTSGSSPAGFGLQPGIEYLATEALDWMTVPVIDQFGKPLSPDISSVLTDGGLDTGVARSKITVVVALFQFARRQSYVYRLYHQIHLIVVASATEISAGIRRRQDHLGCRGNIIAGSGSAAESGEAYIRLHPRSARSGLYRASTAHHDRPACDEHCLWLGRPQRSPEFA